MCRGETKYLIVVDLSKIITSEKLKFVQTKMKVERRPHIVTIDWLFDSLEKGELRDLQAGNYLVKLPW